MNDSISAVLKQIPDDEQMRLGAIALALNKAFWEIGDYVNMMIARQHSGLIQGSIAAIYGAVRAMLNEEISIRTLERWARVADFYSAAMRRQYDELPFSHLELAVRYGDDWYRVLDTSLAYIQQYGRPPSVEWLIRQMANPGQVMPQDDVVLPPEQTNAELTAFASSLERFYQALDRLELPDKDRVRKLIEELQRAISVECGM